ncbi:PREDICTED: uncharacterized protein LOC105448872 [Wasmannia auropunctata]|uniref:uncharacterized protein LOC105448872 n=1 Tax=Wasmannia auropunctata TaxID=64793 RepID=UPI0005ED7F14|nr:PREDICTED: uncharacterized protein LOC105448872 [Wasmannia auropunctata]
MPSCCVPKCKSRSLRGKKCTIKFYGFPKEPHLRKQWLQACQRSDNVHYQLVICEQHFLPGCIEERWTRRGRWGRVTKNSRLVRRVKSGAVPTELMPGTPEPRSVEQQTTPQQTESPQQNGPPQQAVEPLRKQAPGAMPSFSELLTFARGKRKDFSQQFPIDQTQEVGMLLDHMHNLEEEKVRLSMDNMQLYYANLKLFEENQQLKNQYATKSTETTPFGSQGVVFIPVGCVSPQDCNGSPDVPDEGSYTPAYIYTPAPYCI